MAGAFAICEQSDAAEQENPPDSEGLGESAESRDRLEALRQNSDDELNRRIKLPNRPAGGHGRSNGGRWYSHITKRVLLVTLLVLVVGAIAPFAWNYSQSYQSTDDAEIDSHIDPLNSRIDGTVTHYGKVDCNFTMTRK